jgi:ABC-type uncharacterized transport system substrate-binding protein
MIRTTLLFIFILFFVNCIFAQKIVEKNTKQKEVHILAYNSEKALSDIKSGMIQIFLPGGIAAAAELPGDKAFEKKTRYLVYESRLRKIFWR